MTLTLDVLPKVWTKVLVITGRQQRRQSYK